MPGTSECSPDVLYLLVTPSPQPGVPAVLLLPWKVTVMEGSILLTYTPCLCSQLQKLSYTVLSSYSVLLFMIRDAGILQSRIFQSKV